MIATLRRQQGMSLLELLVALAAAALLMALLARVVADVADTRQWLQTRQQTQAQTLEGRRLLQDALRGAWPDQVDQPAVWQADEAGLRFLSRPPTAFRHWGWTQTQLRWERRAANKHVLLMQQAPLQVGAKGFVPEPVVLLESDRAMAFKYADHTPQRRWLAAWSEPRALPALVGLFAAASADPVPIWAAAPLRAFPGSCERQGSDWQCLVADELTRTKGP